MDLSRRQFAQTSFAALLALGAASVTETAFANEEADEQVKWPITIEHAFGSTTIEQAPERIVCLDWGNQDVPLMLGVAPVGFSRVNYGDDGSGIWPWTKAAYEELGAPEPVLFDDTDGYDLEAINDCKPDVILAAYSGMTQESYEALSKIAPVVPNVGPAWETTWREQALVEGEALGMLDEAEELVAQAEELLEKKSAEYGVKGHTGVIAMFVPTDLSVFYIYLPVDPRGNYLLDLGLELPESVKALDDGKQGIALTLPAEMADQFDDIDVMVTYGTPDLLEELQNDPLLGCIPAIQNGAVAFVDYAGLAGACNPSILGIEATIDPYLTIIAEALGTK